MVVIRSVNEIILSLVDFFKIVQPDLDTKPGTVARDLFIEGPASQLSLLYDELSGVSSQQSLRLVAGTDLDRLATNYGISRRQSTPSTGVALLTFSSLTAPIIINAGDTVIANNGLAYTVSSGTVVNPLSSNFYRSVASKFSDQLEFAGITDTYAVEVTVTASSPGSSGNIGTYALSSTTISGVSNVTNTTAFLGGTDQETDAIFRNRVLSTFSGSSVGTALGYLNTALGTTGVSDAKVIEPGDPLMTRDGTDVSIAADGTRTITSEGSGGKVDIVILGTNLIENTDSFIYQDKSNTNDPTNPKNDIVLGQIEGDENKTINRRRIDNIKNTQLPAQPVENLLTVSGSESGSNFAPMTTDSLGRVSGNYELVKDDGVYGGSPWGFDKFRWRSNKISLFQEDRIKGQPNGQDSTTFTDVLEIPRTQQSLPISNENSQVTFDRSIIQLLHTPANNVTRVFNTTTGERYIITNQNLDNTSPFNSTGRIKISGNTLPSPTDNLQVDYNWIVDYDPHSDYNGLAGTNSPRPVTDSIDWGYSSAVRRERINFTLNSGDNFFAGTSSHPINSVIAASKFLEIDGYVTTITSGAFINRLAVNVTRLLDVVTAVNSVTLKNSNTELYVTSQSDGTFVNSTEVVGIEVLEGTTVILPTDTVATVGDRVTVLMNITNIFQSGTTTGSSSATQITIPETLVDTTATNIVLLVDYIAEITDLFSSGTTSLPTSRAGNGYVLLNNIGFTNFSNANASRREHQSVQLNDSSQFFVDLTPVAVDYVLNPTDVLTVIRLSDGKELWNQDNLGIVSVGNNGNYQLIFSGYNTPATLDRVLVVYYATDIRRFQPFSIANYPINTRVDSLAINFGLNRYMVSLNSFASQLDGYLQFSVLEPNSDIALFTVTDGYLLAGTSTAGITSSTANFSSAADLLNKKVRITSSTSSNNLGIYDITAYDLGTNTITITNVLNNVKHDQISVIRISDGKELWSYSGTIDAANNRLLIPVTTAANNGDKVFVYFYNFKNLRQSPTRIVGTTVDQIINGGVMSISGTTLAKVQDVVFTATNNGLRLNVNEAMRKVLSLNSSSSLPTNVKIAKVIKVEKVVTASVTDDSVISVLATYDVKNSTIRDNILFSSEMLGNIALSNLDFILPNTQNNTSTGESQNLPAIGDKIRITFYYVTENDIENLSYSRNGTLYTNKRFALINRMFTSSGFKGSLSTTFTASSFTQPSLGARYNMFYDYLAPKQNERIVITYNYNRLVGDTTFNVENSRPINADVIVRAAKEILLDLTINVVIADSAKSSENTVLQNLRDQLVNTLTTNTLGETVDTVTIINVAQSVTGIARARVLYFNKTGGIGQVSSITAQSDEFFVSNLITINTETR